MYLNIYVYMFIWWPTVGINTQHGKNINMDDPCWVLLPTMSHTIYS